MQHQLILIASFPTLPCLSSLHSFSSSFPEWHHNPLVSSISPYFVNFFLLCVIFSSPSLFYIYSLPSQSDIIILSSISPYFANLFILTVSFLVTFPLFFCIYSFISSFLKWLHIPLHFRLFHHISRTSVLHPDRLLFPSLP